MAARAQPVLGYDNSSPSTLVSYYDGPCSPMNDPQQTAPILQCYTNQPDRITVIDLRDLDKGMEALHLSSLPPTLVKLFEDILRDSRHKSLPHMILSKKGSQLKFKKHCLKSAISQTLVKQSMQVSCKSAKKSEKK